MNQTDLTLDPNKQHIVFVKGSELRLQVANDLVNQRIAHCVIHGGIDGNDDVIQQFGVSMFQVLVLNPAWVSGWRTKFTEDQCDVHFVGEFGDAERHQGMLRLSPKHIPEIVMYSEEQYKAMEEVAMTNKRLAEELLKRLGESGAREGILLDTLRLNHDWHVQNEAADPKAEYSDSSLYEANMKALELPQDDTALKIVMINRNPVEMVRHFNKIAGNTDDRFNVRQAAMYFGLQLEEMAEKLTTVFDRSLPESAWFFAEAMDQYGVKFKTGEFDHLIVAADRKDLLDDDVDQLVVTIGSLLSQGVDIHGAVAEVHRANMDKVWPDGTMHRDEFGKIVKPDGWREPDLTPFVFVDEFFDTPLGKSADDPSGS